MVISRFGQSSSQNAYWYRPGWDKNRGGRIGFDGGGGYPTPGTDTAGFYLDVLGGGMSKIEQLYENVPRRWGEYVFSDEVETRLATTASR